MTALPFTGTFWIFLLYFCFFADSSLPGSRKKHFFGRIHHLVLLGFFAFTSNMAKIPERLILDVRNVCLAYVDAVSAGTQIFCLSAFGRVMVTAKSVVVAFFYGIVKAFKHRTCIVLRKRKAFVTAET